LAKDVQSVATAHARPHMPHTRRTWCVHGVTAGRHRQYCSSTARKVGMQSLPAVPFKHTMQKKHTPARQRKLRCMQCEERPQIPSIPTGSSIRRSSRKCCQPAACHGVLRPSLLLTRLAAEGSHLAAGARLADSPSLTQPWHVGACAVPAAKGPRGQLCQHNLRAQHLSFQGCTLAGHDGPSSSKGSLKPPQHIHGQTLLHPLDPQASRGLSRAQDSAQHSWGSRGAGGRRRRCCCRV
jgi:hypothetical protein